jgi:hypothetical protein
VWTLKLIRLTDRPIFHIVDLLNVIIMKSPTYAIRGSLVVKALCYKPEGRGFDPNEVNF